MTNFKDFVLNEEKNYLGHKVGDVLTSLQDLQGDMANLGTRHLGQLAEEIVNQIRKILHDSWSPKYQKHLKELQKIAVAIQKTIDEKGDLRQTLPVAAQALQALSGQIGVKVNSLEAPPEMPGEYVKPDDFQLTGGGPAPKENTTAQQPPTMPTQAL
jgi:hypothetical protein